MLDVKHKIDHCNLFSNSTRIVSFLYKTEGMSWYPINIYSILDLYFIAKLPNAELTGNHTSNLSTLVM